MTLEEFIDWLNNNIEDIRTDGKAWKKYNNGRIAFDFTYWNETRQTCGAQKMNGDCLGFGQRFTTIDDYKSELKRLFPGMIKWKTKPKYEQLSLFD